MTGIFCGVLIFIIFMVALSIAVMKFPPMKINASTQVAALISLPTFPGHFVTLPTRTHLISYVGGVTPPPNSHTHSKPPLPFP